MLKPATNVPLGAEILWAAGEFALQLVKSKIDPRVRVKQPSGTILPLPLQIELEGIAEGCYRAFRNRSKLLPISLIATSIYPHRNYDMVHR
jgi:hypothetical protein